jgi:hypothetical protein
MGSKPGFAGPGLVKVWTKVVTGFIDKNLQKPA